MGTSEERGQDMATDRTKALLLEHEQFAQLDVDEQRRRIAEYIADWYDPDGWIPEKC